MPIIDRREITFDTPAILEAIANTPRIVRAMNLPAARPEDVRFNSDKSEVTLLYGAGGQSFRVQPESLKTLLVSYCLYAGIKVPRTMERSVRIDDATVVLVFEASLPLKPATIIPRQQGVPTARRSVSWFEPAIT